MKFQVVTERKSEFGNPIKLKCGDHVLIVKESKDQWPGWLYCQTKLNAGWVPNQIVSRKADLGQLTKDYDATEFDLDIGDIIIKSYELNGWIWGYKQSNPNKWGWTPLSHIEII